MLGVRTFGWPISSARCREQVKAMRGGFSELRRCCIMMMPSFRECKKIRIAGLDDVVNMD